MEKNQELIRRLYALFTKGDAAAADLVAEDCVVDFSRRLLDGFVLRGRDQVRAAFETGELAREWTTWPTWEPLEMHSSGDKVLVFMRFSGTGKASGVEVSVVVANLWTFRDGVPIEMTYLGEDRAAAFETAGMTPG